MQNDSVMGMTLVIRFPFKKINEPEIDLPDYMKKYDSRQSWGLVSLPPYIKIPKMNPNVQYSFFQTVASPEAKEAIASSDICKQYDRDDIDFYFDANLMDVYMATLSSAARDMSLFHFQYPRVESGKLVDWPVVHMVESSGLERYLDLVRNLNGLRDFAHFKGDSRNSKKFDLVMNAGTNPLVAIGTTANMSGHRVFTEGQPYKLYRLVHEYRETSYADDD